MVQPIFKDIIEKEVQVDLGEMEKGDISELKVYFIANIKVVPERQRDQIIDLVMECSSDHEDVVLVAGITDAEVALGPVDPTEGPAPFKISFTGSNVCEATASKSHKVDLFLKDLFCRIQKLTKNLFDICSFQDHLGYKTEGIFGLNSNNEEPEDENKIFIPFADYEVSKDSIPSIVKQMDIIMKEEE